MISKKLQIDFMDGKFVPEKSILIYQIPGLKNYDNEFEAHLMVKNPLREIKILKEKGFKKIIFHYESLVIEKKILKVIETIRKYSLICYIAINPKTEINNILPCLSKVDGVLFMGVHPGKEHQDFIPEVYKKISELRKINKNIKVQVDGGATPEVIKKLAKLDVNYINSGSYISDSKNPGEKLKFLEDIFVKNRE